MGDYVQRARKLRPVIEQAATSLDDATSASAHELFPSWNTTSSYDVGVRVKYMGILYKCLQKHNAQADWTPIDAPSLWAKVLTDPSGDVLPWEQPDSTNPYMKGDKVTHNGKTWVCDIDNNVWEPGVYGWSEVSS